MTPGTLELSLPSPTRKLVQAGSRSLWVKDDGAIGGVYGGNKARKLERLLTDAKTRGKRHLLTLGVAGSHHVLATGLWGTHLGFETTALLVARPYSDHAEQTLRLAQSSGLTLLSCYALGDVPRIARAVLRPNTYFIPPGGTNALGALGYFDAVRELEAQIAAGELPEPSRIFVALGTGGTAAGLLAGLSVSKLRSILVAVPVLQLLAPRKLVLTLARRTLRLAGHDIARDLGARLDVETEWLGRGYGHPTQAGDSAVQLADSLGLRLESTYTAKAFAAALGWLDWPKNRGNSEARSVGASRSHGDLAAPESMGPAYGPADSDENALFWSTISSTIVSPSSSRAVTLRPAIERLLRR